MGGKKDPANPLKYTSTECQDISPVSHQESGYKTPKAQVNNPKYDKVLYPD